MDNYQHCQAGLPLQTALICHDMLKTPVSVLLELTVQKKIGAPDYQTNGTGQAHCMAFTCHVKACGQTAVGVGSTKKDAKHDAARNMLKLLGIKLDSEAQMSPICLLPIKSSKLDGPVINYIGKLNEFCSGHRYPQPTYNECVTVQNAQFTVICNFNNFKTEGYGYNKKDAKQDSARKMLALVKDSGIENVEVQEAAVNKLEVNSEISEQVLKRYTELMNNMDLNDNERENINLESVDEEVVNVSTWGDVEELLAKHGYAYELSTFQQHPLILSLKINEYVLMHYGNSREEILKKFVVSVVDIIKKGIDFSKPLMAL